MSANRPPPNRWLSDSAEGTAVPAVGVAESAETAEELRAASRRVSDALASEDRVAGQDLAELLERADPRDSYSQVQRGVRLKNNIYM